MLLLTLMLFLLLLLPFAIFRFRVQTLGFNGSMSALLAGWLACGLSSFYFFGAQKVFFAAGWLLMC